jgi:hypothetical protein
MKHAFFRRLKGILLTIARFLAYVVSMLSRKRKPGVHVKFKTKTYTVDMSVGRKETDYGKSESEQQQTSADR